MTDPERPRSVIDAVRMPGVEAEAGWDMVRGYFSDAIEDLNLDQYPSLAEGLRKIFALRRASFRGELPDTEFYKQVSSFGDRLQDPQARAVNTALGFLATALPHDHGSGEDWLIL